MRPAGPLPGFLAARAGQPRLQRGRRRVARRRWCPPSGSCATPVSRALMAMRPWSATGPRANASGGSPCRPRRSPCCRLWSRSSDLASCSSRSARWPRASRVRARSSEVLIEDRIARGLSVLVASGVALLGSHSGSEPPQARQLGGNHPSPRTWSQNSGRSSSQRTPQVGQRTRARPVTAAPRRGRRRGRRARRAAARHAPPSRAGHGAPSRWRRRAGRTSPAARRRRGG